MSEVNAAKNSAIQATATNDELNDFVCRGCGTVAGALCNDLCPECAPALFKGGCCPFSDDDAHDALVAVFDAAERVVTETSSTGSLVERIRALRVAVEAAQRAGARNGNS